MLVLPGDAPHRVPGTALAAACIAACMLTAWPSLAQPKPAPASTAAQVPATTQTAGQVPAAPVAPPAAAAPAAPAAAAPATPAAPTPEQLEQARAAYARGQQLFSQGAFAEAESAFAEAYAAVPNPVVLLSSAECQVRLGKLQDAYDTLQRYLQQSPGASDRAEVERKAADLASVPATLVLSSEPSGAAIKLDGQDTGKHTPAELSVMRGEHTLELTLSGHQSQTVTVQARIGARHELQAALTAAPAKPAVAAAGQQPAVANLKVEPEEAAHRPTTALWITSIVGAAGLVTGTVLGFMVLAERSDFDANPTDATAKRGERLALFTDVSFGVGAMALVTSAVLYFTADQAAASEKPGQASSARARSPRLALVPAVSSHAAGLSALGRF